jgi:hypothetical protein
MHVEADLLEGVGNVGPGERQVLESPSEAPEMSQIGNRRPRLGEDLGLRIHRIRNWLTVHHACSLKNVKSKLMLSKEEPVNLILYGDSQEMMEGLEIIHGKFPLEGRYGLLQKCCVGCSENNVINIKQ